MRVNMMKRVLAGILCAVMVVLCLPTANTVEAASISPLVDSYQTTTGTFTLTTGTRFFIAVATAPSADLVRTVKLSASEFAADGRPSNTALEIVWGHEEAARDGDIVIRLDSSLASEAYRLQVASDRITVTAKDHYGVRYGLVMIQKLMRLAQSTTIGNCTINDCPDVAERILRLDCARKYFTKNWIINLIREMSWMGYNQLELHFNDDGGLRLDIWDSAYFTSKNGNDFSWICGSQPAYWVTVSDPDQGKHLTAGEMVEIIDVAKQYNIEVVPSFNTPGHSEYMTRRYEEYTTQNGTFEFNYNGKTYNSGTDIYHNGSPDTKYGCIALDSETARAFTLAMIEDYADFFKQYAGSDTFHIGTDEIVFSNDTYNFALGWDTYAQNQGFGTTAYDTYYQYINTVSALLKSKQYRVRAFNDFLELDGMTHTVQLDPDIEITYWSTDSNEHGMATAQEFVNQNRKVYNGIQSYTYYVLRTTKDGKDARDPSHDQWKFTKATAENIWAWWDPALFAQYGDPNVWVDLSNVTGAYYMIWCDYAGLETEQQMWYGAHWDVDAKGGYGLRPRMRACIAKMWKQNADNGCTYDEFFELHDKYLADYPGYAGSEWHVTPVILPAAGEPVQLYAADHTELRALLAAKIGAEPYTDESYAVYETAWNEAQTLDQNLDATAQELSDAATALTNAVDGLQLRDVTLTVYFKAMLDGTEKQLGSEEQTLKWGDSYSVTAPTYTNFAVSSAEGGTLTGKTVTGTLEQDATTVTVWYDCLLDFNPLAKELEKAPTDQSDYGDEDWAGYWQEYERINGLYAAALENPTDVTQEQLDTAVQDLQVAIAKLAYGKVMITVEYLTTVNGETKQISCDTYEWPGMTTYTFPVKHLKNYHFTHVTGAEIVFVDEGANIGTITGLLTEPTTIQLWYDNAPSLAELSGLIGDAPTEQGSYTADSWAAYQTALQQANSFYNSHAAAPALTTYQEQIDGQIVALRNAINALTVAAGDEGTQILDAAAISVTVRRGRQAVISVVTSADVGAITVTCGEKQITLRQSSAVLVQDDEGNVEKRWMIYFLIDANHETGEFTYTIHAGEATRDVTITCQ